MLIAHKIALNPNRRQLAYFAQASGVARFAWNWALAEWQAQFKAGGKPSEMSLRRQLNSIKREQFPWVFDVSKTAVQEAIIDLGSAFDRFFKKNARYPRFKAKDRARDSFCAANEVGTFRTDGKRIKLPVLGWVRMREAVRFSGTCKRVTISRTAGRWFASIMIDTDDVKPAVPPNVAIGVDLGVKMLATLSNAPPVSGPKPHTRLLKRLQRHSRALSRKRKGSQNRRKAKARLARLHCRIANIRKDALHKLTTTLAKGYRRIGIEDLNVRGMSRNRCLARSVMDGGFYEFRQQLEYKTAWYGSQVVVADRWFPSSKTCSCCGVVKETLALSQRIFHCDDCGFECDRDVNAARNLERLAASSAVTACGAERSGAVRKPRVKRAAKKQEENTASEVSEQKCAA
jgi:putative transposase